GMVPGRPAWIMAWRPLAWPAPPWSTWPMITSSMLLTSIPARFTASRMTRAPSWGALKAESPPRYLPMGVRQAERMTGVVASDMGQARCVICPEGNIGGRADGRVGIRVDGSAPGVGPADRLRPTRTHPGPRHARLGQARPEYGSGGPGVVATN